MDERLDRFALPVRLVHQTTAVLFVVCVAAAACLYIGPLAEAVGRRPLVATVHQWAGVLLPLPLVVGLLSRALRADLRRIDRFTDADRRWLRRVPNRGRLAGKSTRARSCTPPGSPVPWSSWSAPGCCCGSGSRCRGSRARACSSSTISAPSPSSWRSPDTCAMPTPIPRHAEGCVRERFRGPGHVTSTARGCPRSPENRGHDHGIVGADPDLGPWTPSQGANVQVSV